MLSRAANRSSCFAHVTNSMAQTEGDFEKGEADGAKATLAVVAAAIRAWSASLANVTTTNTLKNYGST